MEKHAAANEDELFRQLAFGEPPRLEGGRSYLVKERKPGKAWDLFDRMLGEGYEGMYVTRQHPNHVENAHGPRTLKVVWLSTTLGRDYVDPHNLSALTNLINGFIESSRRAIILIDGLEYMRLNNDADRVLKFLEYLDEIVMHRQGILILSLDARAFDARELAFIERNSVVLE
jgi:pentatricopeptide repeat protein